MTGIRSERGQALVLTTLFVAALLGLAALVIDVGSWFRAQRDTQAIADAAALAGVQELPYDVAAARALAVQYTSKNGGENPDVSFPSVDRIKVEVRRDAPGFFASVFGVNSVNVGGKATARAFLPAEARWAAPIGVDEKHPLISGCNPLPCFKQQTTLDLQKTGPGAFRLLNIDGSKGGTGPGTLAEWMLKGYDGFMPLGWYYSDPGAKFNSSQMQSALAARVGDEVLFPIYAETKGQGANFQYKVIGWIGFVITDFEARGNSGTLEGYFTRVIWEGIETSSGSASPDYGVRAIELIE
jgi:hypothetical protein